MRDWLVLMTSFMGLLLFSCGAEPTDEPTNQRTNFFDLRTYITTQVDSLTAAQPTVTKRVVLNKTEEERVMDDVNFAADLRAFREADINKPAWADKYRTVERGGAWLYEALDSSLQTRRLLVQLIDGVPVQIDVWRKTGTLLSNGTQKLTYRPASGYTIDTEQVNRFGDDVSASVSVYWKE